ncbi:hypothetical protein BD769DRAFT_1775650 [Suillus cothurnatus]|nr:hypothetical protein BD769DRAFT_1775650 [Suillus cothurnatus]
MLLYGVICMQTFRYWQAYEHDKKILKCLVASICILETVHTALTVYAVEFISSCISEMSPNLEYAVWGMPASYVIGLLHLANFAIEPKTLDRHLFCYVGNYLLRREIPTQALVIGYFGNHSLWLWTCKLFLKLGKFLLPMWKIFREHVFPTMVVGWVLSAVVDSAIAFTLCLYLRKRRTGMNHINTGAVTSFCAILVVVMFLSLPNNLAFIGLSKFRANYMRYHFGHSLNLAKTGDGQTERSCSGRRCTFVHA